MFFGCGYAALWDGVFVWNGSKWLQTMSGNGFEEDRFGSLCTISIAVDPRQPNVVYAGRWIGFSGHANGIFRSIDSGQYWENITHNLGLEFNVDDISVNPHDRYVYIGSSHGTWKLPSPVVELRIED